MDALVSASAWTEESSLFYILSAPHNPQAEQDTLFSCQPRVIAFMPGAELGMEALPSPDYLPRGPGWQGMEALPSPGSLPRVQAGTVCSQQVLIHVFLG